MAKDIFEQMAEAWGSPVVARTEVKKFSGGVLNSRTLANLDSLGCGIPKRFRVGKHIAYPVTEVVQFLRERAKEVN